MMGPISLVFIPLPANACWINLVLASVESRVDYWATQIWILHWWTFPCVVQFPEMLLQLLTEQGESPILNLCSGLTLSLGRYVCFLNCHLTLSIQCFQLSPQTDPGKSCWCCAGHEK
jgi:hypothetical protein